MKKTVYLFTLLIMVFAFSCGEPEEVAQDKTKAEYTLPDGTELLTPDEATLLYGTWTCIEYNNDIFGFKTFSNTQEGSYYNDGLFEYVICDTITPSGQKYVGLIRYVYRKGNIESNSISAIKSINGNDLYDIAVSITTHEIIPQFTYKTGFNLIELKNGILYSGNNGDNYTKYMKL